MGLVLRPSFIRTRGTFTFTFTCMYLYSIYKHTYYALHRMYVRTGYVCTCAYLGTCASSRDLEESDLCAKFEIFNAIKLNKKKIGAIDERNRE